MAPSTSDRRRASPANAPSPTAPPFVIEALKRHRATQNERRVAAEGVDWRDEDVVVDRGDGGPWLPATFSTYWARWARRNGFEGISYHTLRHGSATLLLAGGVPDAVAATILGHADTKVLRRYQEIVPDLMQHAADQLEALLGD